MRAIRAAAIETFGTTRVLDCCTFEWSEAHGRRLVVMPDQAHPDCLAELERVAAAQGLCVRFIRTGTRP